MHEDNYIALVKEAMNKAGHSDFTMWKEGEDGMQRLSEGSLVMPLVKAVQELSAKNDALEARIATLEG